MAGFFKLLDARQISIMRKGMALALHNSIERMRIGQCGLSRRRSAHVRHQMLGRLLVANDHPRQFAGGGRVRLAEQIGIAILGKKDTPSITIAMLLATLGRKEIKLVTDRVRYRCTHRKQFTHRYLSNSSIVDIRAK